MKCRGVSRRGRSYGRCRQPAHASGPVKQDWNLDDATLQVAFLPPNRSREDAWSTATEATGLGSDRAGEAVGLRADQARQIVSVAGPAGIRIGAQQFFSC